MKLLIERMTMKKVEKICNTPEEEAPESRYFLACEQSETVRQIWEKQDENKNLVSKFRLNITVRDLQSLRTLTFLLHQ